MPIISEMKKTNMKNILKKIYNKYANKKEKGKKS